MSSRVPPESVQAVLDTAFRGASIVSLDTFTAKFPDGPILSDLMPDETDALYAACKQCAGGSDADRRAAVERALARYVPNSGAAAPVAPTQPVPVQPPPPAAQPATPASPASTSAPPRAATSEATNPSSGSAPPAPPSHAAPPPSTTTVPSASATNKAAAGPPPANGGAPKHAASQAPRPAAGSDQVKVVVRHFSALSYKELRRDTTSDRHLVAEFEQFIGLKLAKLVNRSSSGAPSMLLVREVRSRDTKGPYAFDPLEGLMRIEVVALPEGAALATNARFTLRGIDHVSDLDRANNNGGGSTPSAGGLRLWVQQVMEANELGASEARLSGVMEQLRKDGIEELRHLILVSEDYFKRQNSAVMAAILSERNSIVGGGDAEDKGQGVNAAKRSERQRAVVERANFHKVKRLIYSVTGHLSRLTLLDRSVIDEACEIMNEEYSNPTVLALLKKDFLLPYAVQGGAMPRGLLLHGPPGTGKTMLVLLLCEFCGLTMVEPSMMSAGEINRGYVGETEKLLGEMFRRAHIMPYLPCIVAIDEIDSAVPKRDENSASNNSGADKVSVFLSNIQGGTDIPNLALIGASNRRECIDEAVRRRLEIQIYIGYLDGASRATFIDRQLFKKPLHKAFQAVIDAVPGMHDLASDSASAEAFTRDAEAKLMDLDADRGLFRIVCGDVYKLRAKSRAEVTAAVSRRVCPLGAFYACIKSSMLSLTLNFSGAALKKLCSRLATSWDTHVRSTAAEPRPVPLGPLTAADGPLSKTLQYEILINHMRQVSLADDIKVGTQLCYEVLSKTQSLFHPKRLEMLFDDILPKATGLIVVHLDRESGAPDADQSLLLQIEVYNPDNGATELVAFEMRPHCPHCDQFAAAHCSARGPTAKHVFNDDGTPHGSGFVGNGSSEADDRSVHTGRVQGGIRIDDVLALLALVVAKRQLTKLELKNMTTFVAGGATDEKGCIEDFLSTNKRAQAPGSRTLVAVNLESLANVTRNQSEGGMGSTSRSIGNRQLFSYACSSFAEYRCPFNAATGLGLGQPDATGNSAGEALCVLVIQTKYVMEDFRESTQWPLTLQQQIKRDEEAARLREPPKCARCEERYSLAEQEEQAESGAPPTGCQYHAGKPAKRRVTANGEVCLELQPNEQHARSEIAKQTAMLELPEPELPPSTKDDEVKLAKYNFKVKVNPWKSWRMVWTCCPEKPFDAPGCKHEGHSTEPKPADWQPSEGVRRMIAAASSA